MADQPLLMIFSYDIQSDRVRRRVSKLLEARAARVQFSVFEAHLPVAAGHALAREVARHLDEGDSLRVYAVGAFGVARSLTFGPTPPPQAQGFYLV